jgi:replicative DNA helicase
MTDTPQRIEEEHGPAEAIEWWEVPVPLLERPQVPAFPVESLPGWLREWAEALAAEKGASVDIAASLALAVVSGAIARHAQVSPRPGWYEPVSLYVITALVPGQAKTPVFKVALRPVRTLEAKRIADHAQVAQAAGLAQRLVEKQERELLNEAGADADPEELAERLEEFVSKFGQTLEAGPSPRLLTEDVTPEGLAGLIGDHGRIMVASDEGSAMFENLAGRYTRGSASWDLFNKAHAAADLAVDRKGSAPVIVFDPALTLAVATQPAMLRALANKPDAGGRGVLARPLYAIPAPVYAETPTPAAPEQVLAAYSHRIANLYADVPELELDEDEHPRPLRLALAADAREQFERWERSLQDELRGLSADEDDSGLYLGWLSKLAGQTARLAAVVHAAAYWTSGAGTASQTIDKRTLLSAIRLARYYRLHARAAFGLMGELPDQRRARTILRWLLARTEEELQSSTVRDVHRSRGKGTTAEQVHGALRLLEAHGFLRVERERAEGAARGPATRFVRLNPRLQRNLPDRPDEPDELPEPVGSVGRIPGITGGAGPTPSPGDPDYLTYVAAVHENGHITTDEALELEHLHRRREAQDAAEHRYGTQEPERRARPRIHLPPHPAEEEKR